MSALASSARHNEYFQAIRIGASQRITTTGTAAPSTRLDTGAATRTTLVYLFPTQDCWIKVGEQGSTVAAVNDGTSMFLPGGIKDFIGIPENLARPVISVIQDSAGGYLHVTEASNTGA